MKESVHVVGARRPGGQSMNGIYLDGTTVALVMKDMIPKHDAEKGIYYLCSDGKKWKPVHDLRMTESGEYAGGPGWLEPLEDEEALTPED
jgi:hypothetical protein